MTEQRVIELHPQRPPGQRWDGTVRPDPCETPRHWCGGDCETVERMMTDDLGPLPDGQAYQVIEGGA